MGWARGYAERTIRAMVWDFFASLGWPHYAVVVALLLMLLGMAGLVLGAPMKRVAVLGGLSFALFLASFYNWPPPPPEPEPPKPISIDLSGVGKKLGDIGEGVLDLADGIMTTGEAVLEKGGELAAEGGKIAVKVAVKVGEEGLKLLSQGKDYLGERLTAAYEWCRAKLAPRGIILPVYERLTPEEWARREKARKQEEKLARFRAIKQREAERRAAAACYNAGANVAIEEILRQEGIRARQQQAEHERMQQERWRRAMNGGRP